MSGLWVEAPIFKGCSLVEPELGALQLILAKKNKNGGCPLKTRSSAALTAEECARGTRRGVKTDGMWNVMFEGVTNAFKNKPLEICYKVFLSIAMIRLLCHFKAYWPFLPGVEKKRQRKEYRASLDDVSAANLQSCQVTPSYWLCK